MALDNILPCSCCRCSVPSRTAANCPAAAFLNADSPTLLMNIIFALAGIGWATINVNFFPMVVELADGNLAVIHNASLLRTAGADVMIEDLTKSDLSRYRLEGTGEQFPLLVDVLSLFDGKTPLIVELKSERGNYNALTAATMAMLDRYHVTYCIESFDLRCQMWLKKHRSKILRGQLSARFLLHGDGAPHGKAILFALANLMMNFLSRPDFIAYRYEDRRCLSLWLCRRIYRVQEINRTITTKEEMVDAEHAGNLVIFERFDPRGAL